MSSCTMREGLDYIDERVDLAAERGTFIGVAGAEVLLAWASVSCEADSVASWDLQ
jgi:hypothetical protein